MVHRKEVRFSSEQSFSDSDACSVSSSVDHQNTSVKPILVKRGSTSPTLSSGSSTDSLRANQESSFRTEASKKPNTDRDDPDKVLSKNGTNDSQKIRLTEQSAPQKPVDSNDTKVSPADKQSNGSATVPEERTVVRKDRCKSAPPARRYHWDSSTKQWFSNKSLWHRDNDKPTEVRLFKLNVNEPKINRWVTGTHQVTRPTKAKHKKCSSTVDLVNSLARDINSGYSHPSSNQPSSVNFSSGFSQPPNDTRNPVSVSSGYTYPSCVPSNPVGASSDYIQLKSDSGGIDCRPDFASSRGGDFNPTIQSTSPGSTFHIPSELTEPGTAAPESRDAWMQSSRGVLHLGERVSRDAEVGMMSLGSVYPPDQVSKSQAKAELQAISTRLGSYIQYVREISENANQVDLAAFINSIKILEDELVNIKNMYEAELDSTRQEVEELSRTKNQFQQEIHKLKAQVAELENRLVTEADKNRQAVNEINNLQRALMQRDRELTESKLALQKPISDLEVLSKEFNCVLREKEDCRRRLEHEQLQRQEAESKNNQLQKKIEIDNRVHEEEVNDLNDRLNAASNTILTLESKIREMTHADTALSDMLQRVRDVAETEVERYRQESEARFSQNVSELQSQLNECNRKIADLNDRNQQLHMEIGDYQSKIRTLQGQVTSLNHQKSVLEDELMSDRQRSHEHIKRLEHKLVELQDNIITKMRQLNAARDAQIPLKAEIETLRSMLEEEEQRLKLPPTPRLDIPDAPPYGGTSSAPHSAYPKYNNQPESPRPVGPVRVRSAPPSKQHFVPTTLGQGKDYFEEMFNDLKVRELRDSLGISNMIPKPPAEPKNETETDLAEEDKPTTNDKPSPVPPKNYNYTSSSTGDIKILEVHPEGKYVRLINTALTKDEELGGYMIQQNVGGHPVAVYRFPPRVTLPANQTVTVWTACNDYSVHKPPTDYYFKEQQKWGTGPECTTIVCKPNGQAISWTTASHRKTQDLYYETGSTSSQNNGEIDNNLPDSEKVKADELMVYNMDVNAAPKDPIYLRREKEQPPSLHPQKHPYGVSPPNAVHPHTGQPRPLTYGNDNSSVNRQSRIQSTRPDPVPGAPYAGASAQRMGSASLRKYQGPTIKGSGAIANKSSNADGPVTSRPPSSFQTPRDRFETGMIQLNSQYNLDFQPPMPRPPLFATW